MISVPEKLAELAGDDQAKAFNARYQLLEAAYQSTRPGNQAEQSALADALAAELTAKVPVETKADEKKKKDAPEERFKHSTKVRREAIEILGVVAGPKQVPAIVSALDELELRETARCALDRVGGKEACAALIAALDRVGSEFRVGVAGSLAKRRGDDVLRALKGLATDTDLEVRLAAVEALAELGDPDCESAMVQAYRAPTTPTAAHDRPLSPRGELRITKARIRLAERLRLAGHKTAARYIYHSILGEGAPLPQIKAAQIGIEQMA